jgi:HSP20 family molecular chaperone IbpA
VLPVSSSAALLSREPTAACGQEADDEIVVRAEAPGFEPKDFDIHISGNTLTIEGEHKEEGEEKEDGYRQWHQRYGRFQRTVPGESDRQVPQLPQ